jgi:hypothetical protein
VRKCPRSRTTCSWAGAPTSTGSSCARAAS